VIAVAAYPTYSSLNALCMKEVCTECLSGKLQSCWLRKYYSKTLAWGWNRLSSLDCIALTVPDSYVLLEPQHTVGLRGRVAFSLGLL
jgi:hypothetical protein